MPKLPSPKPRFSVISPKLKASWHTPQYERHRRENKGHKLYNSRRWRGSDSKSGRDGLRYQTLLAWHFTCAMCHIQEPDTSKLVADHIRPHKGDEQLFFDETNLQCLCKSCHDSKKQSIERRQNS